MKQLFKFTVPLALAAAAMAQPVVTSALNNASYTLPELPNSGLARGSMVAVFGSNLAAQGTQLADKWPLETTMRGTSAKITVGGTTVDALMAYTTPGQIGIIVPSNTPEGNGTLTVTYNGQTSATVNVRIVRSTFGAFTRNSQGSGPASVENASQEGRPINALNRPARPGEVLVLWGTGLGPVTQNEAAGPVPGDLPVDVEVYVGGQRAAVSYKGRSGCCAGIDQIAFTVPQNVEGCYVPVVVKVGDTVSNFSTIAVGRGSACSDPTFSSDDLQRISQSGTYRFGTVLLSRTVSKMSIPGFGSVDNNTDSGFASFSKVDYSSLASSVASVGGVQSTVMGACIVSSYRFSGETPVVPSITVTPLDAGAAINVSGPKGAKQLTKQPSVPGVYMAELGGGMNIPGLPGGIPGQATQPPYLDAGDYRIDNGSGATGENAVGAFQLTLRLNAPLTWTNMDAISTVTRANGQEITWSGGQGTVVITGMTMNMNARVAASFTCMERASAGRFTVPSYVLLSLPASQAGPGGAAIDSLSVSNMTDPVRFTATGLDAGFAMASFTNTKTVTYR